MDRPTITTRQKALALNLDARTYGTFAEIGGGQEVARAFFAAGGAAGTLAKSISAYDMAVSDSLYGAAKRYVSRERLEAMLALEFSQLVQQLGEKRGESKCFFAFANTVATRRFGSDENGRGWLGVRFQAHPREEPSEDGCRRISTLAAWAVSPSFSARIRRSSATRARPRAENISTLERRRKSLAHRPLAKRAVPPVGSTWLGPAT